MSWKGYLFCLIVAYVYSSCNVFVATPYPVVDRFDGRNDLHVQLNGGVSGGNLTATYSPLNHLYVGGGAHVMSWEPHSLSGGPIAGYYYNSADSTFHFNAGLGVMFGNIDFGGGGLSGRAAVTDYHFQLFISQQIGRKHKHDFGGGFYLQAVDLNYSHMEYTYNGPDSLAANGRIAGIFVFGQRKLFVPQLKFCYVFGRQLFMCDYGDPGEYYIYDPWIFRIGISYQFHPGRRKNNSR